jgi:hypothetical protein
MMSIWALANDRVRFADLPLTLSPNDIVEQLQQKGMRLVVDDQTPNTYRLTGQLAGLKVDADLHYTRDSMRVNYLRLSTRTAARSVLEDYRVVMQWMEKHYGKPTWESTVRSHPFARWFGDFDQDIVVIDTAEYALPGVDPEFRPITSVWILSSLVTDRLSAYYELNTKHNLAYRRYYHQFDY